MSKIIITALAMSLLILGFSGALFAFELPIWLPVILVLLSVVLVALMASKVATKMRKERKEGSTRKYNMTNTSVVLTPLRTAYPRVPNPPSPRR